MTVDTDDPRIVLHFGPDLREPGGIAQVIHAYFEADLGPWKIDFVSIYTKVSRARQLVRLVAAVGGLLIRPRGRTHGVHVHTSYGFDLVRTLLLLETARLRRLPTVVTVHGSRFMNDVRRAPRLVRAIFVRAGAVTVLTDEVHEAAVSLGARRVLRLANPVRVRAPAVGVAARRQVLFAGEIGYRKGVDLLLGAWPTVHTQHPDASLRLLGPVAEPALIASLPAGASFGGPLSHAAVIEALDDSCIAVLPSRAEAMPMFVLEAMAAGVPVVATGVGAVSSVLGGAGVIIPVDDADAIAAALADLLGNHGKLAELSQNGQRLVSEQFSTDVFTRHVTDLYGSVFRQ